MNNSDDLDEPVDHYPDEMLENFATPSPPPGFSWWRGWWPTYGLDSPDDLKLYVEVELDQMISREDGPLAKFGLALGVQALKNADRYLGLHGDGDHPRRPSDDELQDAGTVEDALESLVRFLREKQQPQSPPTPPPAIPPAPKPRKRRTPEEIEVKIGEYVRRIVPKLDLLREGAQADRKDAIEAAKALIGRNSIHRATGIPSGSVSNSAIYRQLAAEFHLERDRPALDKSKAIGLDIAIEEKAMGADDPVVEEVARREAAEFIRAKLGEDEAAELLLGQLEGRNISPDEAMEYAQVMLDNKDETRTRRKAR